MRTLWMRTLVACSVLVSTATLAPADDVSNFRIERRSLEQREHAAAGVRQIAYDSELDEMSEALPNRMMPMFDSMPEAEYEPIVVSDDAYQTEDDYCCDSCAEDCCPSCGNGCPSCGSCCQSCGCRKSKCGCLSANCCCDAAPSMWYAEAQSMFLRAHVVEESLGKLSEKYEYTPRFILGHEGASGFGVRARYWTYGRETPNLHEDDDALRMDFDVVDLEGTSRLRGGRTDLLLACGFRWVSADIEVDDEEVYSDMPGLTVAADVRSWVCRTCRSEWSGIGGARWSILGADWKGDDDAFIEPMRDDNLVVTELYGGVEYLRHCGSCNVYARIVFEMQNWRSDALGESADTDSIGFVGPGIHAGATY